MTNPLFTPARIGSIDLPNRLVMAPLTRNRAHADGVPSDLMVRHYADRASAGLIIAEGTTPNAVGQTYPDIPGIHTDAQEAGWRRVTEAVRARSGRMVLQLQHGGRNGHPDTSGHLPLAPSAIALPEDVQTPSGPQPAPVPREMTLDDIRSTVADFAAAARRAVAAGFEGVEVHGANGQLLHQFLSENSNLRTDEYGGAPGQRIRFAVEVVRAVAEAIGPERVGLRISPGATVNGMAEGDTYAIYRALVGELARDGLAYLHLVYADSDPRLFAELRELWPGVLIGNPVLTREDVAADGGLRKGGLLHAAGADLISLGRGFLANPDLVERLKAGAPLNVVRDKYLMYTGGATGYNDYPTLAQALAA
ncbi:alkene reductase [Streptomyces indicus]|uniref:N-ethylmaleimide reductase n=1 Tax=Streptomyces indicus TaxID=417292 RepID=A0A1G9JUP8_9ACTN|nr:alkene reductase [Streptomyces indicus]SDL40935.1 N-ethylmaleimide reductase [Streptomyces indicus]